jgi:hypothetical protein
MNRIKGILDSGPGFKHSGAGFLRRNDVPGLPGDFFNKLLKGKAMAFFPERT